MKLSVTQSQSLFLLSYIMMLKWNTNTIPSNTAIYSFRQPNNDYLKIYTVVVNEA